MLNQRLIELKRWSHLGNETFNSFKIKWNGELNCEAAFSFFSHLGTQFALHFWIRWWNQFDLSCLPWFSAVYWAISFFKYFGGVFKWNGKIGSLKDQLLHLFKAQARKMKIDFVCRVAISFLRRSATLNRLNEVYWAIIHSKKANPIVACCQNLIFLALGNFFDTQAQVGKIPQSIFCWHYQRLGNSVYLWFIK